MGLGDKLETTPITEYQYRLKTDFRVYFRLVGVPEYDSLMFHKRIRNKNIGGALLAIRNSMKDTVWKYHIRYLFAHLVNAVERREGIEVYVRSRGKKKNYHDVYDLGDFIERRNKIKAIANAVDKNL